MILPKIRDPRFITLRRGGTLSDTDHHQLALWAADCAHRVLPYFEEARPDDDRVRSALEQTAAWVRGEISMTQARVAAFHANAAARQLKGAPRMAAYAAGQAVAVAHVAAHDLGAAAYAIKAVMAAHHEVTRGPEGQKEWEWQIEHLPSGLRELVLDDQHRRNDLCWNVFG